jgi:ABC-type transport system involved in multi-copper enzyme maturation permease subunit
VNALVRKELRQLLPAWVAALLLAAAPTWLIPSWIFHRGDDALSLALGCFTLGALLLGLSSFGKEIGAGTFQQFLSQPAPRGRLWRLKVGTLGIAALVVWVAFLASCGLRSTGLGDRTSLGFFALFSGLAVCVAAAGGLWTTLLLRQVAASFWLAIVVPVLILFLAFLVTEKIFEWGPSFQMWTQIGLLAAYSVAGILWARRLFLRAQDVQWTGGMLVFPAWLRVKTRAASASVGRRSNPLHALIWKEMELQHVGLLVGASAALLQVVSFGARSWSAEAPGFDKVYSVLLAGWMILWVALPFLLGSVAVAEERKLGTLESALCLPVKARSQLAIKFGVALVLAVLLAALVPWTLGGLAFHFGMRGGPFGDGFQPGDLKALMLLSLAMTAVCWYASTLARSTLQAMGVAVGASLFLGYLVVGSANPLVAFGVPLWQGWRLAACIGVPLITMCLIGLAHRNYRRLQLGSADWVRNLVVAALFILFAVIATVMVYNRSWELIVNPEPAHGARQLTGPIRPGICFSGRKLFILLPDGRLWVSGRSQERFLYEYWQAGKSHRVYYPVPLDGEFIGGSNWSQIANDWRGVVAVQGDGSLWQFSVPSHTNRFIEAQPARVGTDTDWQRVAAGPGYYLALKKDGTLWGWGNNRSSLLGAGAGQFVAEPVRIGTHSDWAAVYASWQTCVAVTRNGGVWKWGNLLYGPRGREGWNAGCYAMPVRWDLNGSDWVALTGEPNFDLALCRDGTLRISGDLPGNILGNNLGHDFGLLFSAKAVRVGHESDWADVEVSGNRLVALKTSGTLLVNKPLYATSWFGIGLDRRPSRYSDWIAVSAAWSDPYVALAADGTLCCWWDQSPDQSDSRPTLLGPSRRPLWSLNILARSR